MQYHLVPHGLAALKVPAYAIVPLSGMLLAGIVIIATMYFSHRRRTLWHETARLALEKGQPLPPYPEDDSQAFARVRSESNDIRSGLLLIAVGVGFFLFLNGVGARQASMLGAIPGLIGVALLIYGLSSAGKKSSSDRSP